MKYIIIVLIVAAFITLFVFMLKNPQSSFIKWLVSWKYRQLRELRGEYVWGLQKDPPDSYEYFRNQAVHKLASKGAAHVRECDELCEMLSFPDYIHYYLYRKEFSGKVYCQMEDDYRTGLFRTRNYQAINPLRECLPLAISTNEDAFNDFLKFVEAGWFNAETGMFILDKKEGRKKQHIGRAIYWICKRNGIAAPGRVFAPLFNMNTNTVCGWYRENDNETVTQNIDAIVLHILEK